MQSIKLNKITHIPVRRWGQGDLLHVPSVALVVPPWPHWRAPVGANAGVDVEGADVVAVHVVPERQAVIASTSLRGDQSCSLALVVWVGAFCVHVVTCNNRQL